MFTIKRKFLLGMGAVICVAIGFFAGNHFRNIGNSNSGAGHQVREGGYSFINPLLECDVVQKSVQNKRFVDMSADLEKIIKTKKDNKELLELAVYYRDLNNGPWFGLHEEEKFLPASLLKIPLAISVYRQSEIDPDLLKRVILYEGSDVHTTQFFKPKQSLVSGEKYSVEYLVEQMLIESDNNAALLLVQIITKDQLQGTYKDLGIGIPDLSTYSISVKDYASFLRVLFNSSYLSKENSEKILSILSKTTFDKGIKIGVPKEVTVSHKFGESFPDLKKDTVKQLHDCGIVYNTNKPYLLCVMTQGYDLDVLNQTIEDISKAVYSKNLSK